MFRIVLTIVTTVIVFGSVVSQQPKVAPSGINEAMLKAHIKFLSDDMPQDLRRA